MVISFISTYIFGPFGEFRRKFVRILSNLQAGFEEFLSQMLRVADVSWREPILDMIFMVQ